MADLTPFLIHVHVDDRPKPTLTEWLDESYDRADRQVKARIEDANRIHRGKPKGYTKHLAAIERDIAAVRGYRNAVNELREAIERGDVILP
jgi:hypothetical protein